MRDTCCRFLEVHDYFESDSIYKGCVRVIAHADRSKAVVWKYESVGDKTVLQLVANHDSTGQNAVGGYLTVPKGAQRDRESSYIAVCRVWAGDGLAIKAQGV